MHKGILEFVMNDDSIHDNWKKVDNLYLANR